MEAGRALGVVMLVGAAGAAAYMVMRGQALALPVGGTVVPVLTPPVSVTPPASSPPAAARPTTGPRGIRNNNPGNITAGLVPWKGQAGTDGRYIVFESPVWGVRAIYRLLGNYRLLYGIDTIAKIANRWAPAPENNPAAYASNVALAAGVPMNQALNFNDFDTMTRVARGIIVAENGTGFASYYPAALFSQAWALRG